MKAIAIIPARMGSSRFPGKPLASLLGRTMIEHVYRRVAMSESVVETFIATCDEEIRVAAEGFGAPVLMTADSHERASDRVAEAARAVEADVVVMVQGDEPMVVPGMIDAALAPFFDDHELGCVNLALPIDSEAEWRNPNTIKVVVDQNNNALFMSRQPIPTAPGPSGRSPLALKQVCIIPFRHDLLQRYTELPPTPLEQAESIDMMRFIEHGYPVRMVPTDVDTHAVDTPEDLERVSRRMAGDPLCEVYSS